MACLFGVPALSRDPHRGCRFVVRLNIMARYCGSRLGDRDDEDQTYNRLIAVTSLPDALIRAMASAVFSVTVAM